MNVLLTGGAGFIGSHLAESLLQDGHKVTIIDKFHPYYDYKRKKEQLDRIFSYANLTFCENDLLDKESCAPIFHQSFDAVFHLAALPGVPYSFEQPLEYVDEDIKATINVLTMAGEAGIPHVLFGSSSSVYGNRDGEMSEDLPIQTVMSPYAAAKVSGEAYAHMYQHVYGFQLTVFRYFTVYGPWGRPDMAIPKFIQANLKGESIDVFGSGTARDYTYIDDIVDGMRLALAHSKGNQIYNIGSGNPITIEELVQTLKEIFPDMKVNHAPFRLGDVKQTWADLTKAKRLLGYEPKHSFEEGLRKTVQWFIRHER
ncbi:MULTISPECIES: NAD-dependent epimerase/dehydratase family protein [Pontibacillus]|uniref:GDP-mannose 4,6-dehydratase n=1 Tax=Pontibacillus chungwhensis TaxID=265426 RepID=A0ABY8UU08_9BACI|nr:MULTISPECIES: NAD-dependent epimerase/dehydratase family protein [Pontibacillus]MCD5323782.1 GDP-mannose 4,6-dehydratase [Pontibacillus sp. HN14]WIF97146.1 GDP-mannose 4,6-dehydratase [Pontibacillus chungwhensis]